MLLFQFVKTWTISPTERVCLVKVIVKTGHLAINQLDDVITDVKITGLANFARVSILFPIFFYREYVVISYRDYEIDLEKKNNIQCSLVISSPLFRDCYSDDPKYSQFISHHL